MDQKSTRLGYSKPVKAVAFLLGAVFFCLTAVFGTQVVLYGGNYGGSVAALMQADESEPFQLFVSSHRFQRNVQEFVSDLDDYISTYQGEQAVADGSAFLAIQKTLEGERDAAIHDALKQGRVLEPEMTSKAGGHTLTVPATDAAGATIPESTTKASPSADATHVYYNGNPLYFNADGTFDEETTRQEITENYENRIRTQRMTFENDFRRVDARVKLMRTLKYAVVSRETGQVYTNLAEALPKDADVPAMIRESYQEHGETEYWYLLYSREQNLYEEAQSVSTQSYWDNSPYQTLDGTEMSKTCDIYLFMPRPEGSADVLASLYQNYLSVHYHFFDMAVVTVLSLIGLLAVSVFLACKAGRKVRGGEVTLLWSDRPYNDLHFFCSLILTGAGIGGTVLLTILFSDPEYSTALSSEIGTLCRFGAVVCGLVGGAFLLEWLLSAARHRKQHDLLRHTLLYRILRLLGKGGKRLTRWLLTPLRKLYRAVKGARLRYTFQSVKQTALLAVIGYLGGSFVLACCFGIALMTRSAFSAFAMVLILVLYHVLVWIFLWKTLVSLDEIMTAVESAQNGNLDYPLDPEQMPRFLKKFAADIITMQQGIKAAVEEAVKGERMKTELITNVSHDLKTPLTSIINYVDLLKRCEIPDETAQNYLGVLTEKSARLKRLIEDLTEASKASTGNIKLHPVRVNLYELAMQAIGEYEDDLTGQGIEIRLNTPEIQPVILADSQKLWRVIDNLISNVKKYSLAGTRAYVQVAQEGNQGIISIKNISRAALDIPPEQLTQRFVRGDASRTTEGSGLGLSIAQNFVELMHGTFDIVIDGDLFKVTVSIPLAPPASDEGPVAPPAQTPDRTDK